MSEARSPVVFVGPTSPEAEVERLLPGSRVLPPAARGDVLQAALTNPEVICLIDGYFEHRLAVHHKEILWALKQGIPVYGAASMGALRAAELAQFGMTGVGVIYQSFAEGRWENDDEVALAHGPAPNFQAGSEPLVNIRATLALALAEQIIEPAVERALIALAADTFYPERTYGSLFEKASERNVDSASCRRLQEWLIQHRVDQKRLDACALLSEVQAARASGHLALGSADWDFPWTSAWAMLWRECAQRS